MWRWRGHAPGSEKHTFASGIPEYLLPVGVQNTAGDRAAFAKRLTSSCARTWARLGLIDSNSVRKSGALSAPRTSIVNFNARALEKYAKTALHTDQGIRFTVAGRANGQTVRFEQA